MKSPDRWVMLKIVSDEYGTVYKLFMGDYGGWAGSDSWNLNSGIKKIVETEKTYEVFGYSGSTYICYKNSEGMSMYMQSILSNFVDKLGDAISVVTPEEVVKAVV